MKPDELYKRTPERIDSGIECLKGFYYDHLPEIGWLETFDADFVDHQKRVTIHYYKYWRHDGRRIWLLAGVFFDDMPVMIIQNAGREGDDYSGRFITNKALYNDMVKYIVSLMDFSKSDDKDLIDPDTDIPSLTTFYGYSLDGYFDRY